MGRDLQVIKWDIGGQKSEVQRGDQLELSDKRKKNGSDSWPWAVPILEELQGGRKLTRGELIRCRVRYFSDGLVPGSRDFEEETFQRKREWFGSKRKPGARGLPESEGKLFAMRDLKVRALE